MIIDGEKWACESCVRGHRVSNCTHADRPLQHINKKGRPVSQCQHCRSMRRSKSAHVKCDCGEKTSKCVHLQPTLEGHRDSCCCNHGGRCTCSHKKEQPHLDTVPESDSDRETSSSSNTKLSKTARNRRSRASTQTSDGMLQFDEHGHHKPTYKHAKPHQTSGPYPLTRDHSSQSAGSVGNRSMENLANGSTNVATGSMSQAQDQRLTKSETASPLMTGTSSIAQTSTSSLPPLDLSAVHNWPTFPSSDFNMFGMDDLEPPLVSAGLSAASVDWGQYGLGFDSKDVGNFAPSSYSQTASFGGFDQPSTMTSGEVSEVEDFGPTAADEFDPIGTFSRTNTSSTGFSFTPPQESLAGAVGLGSGDFDFNKINKELEGNKFYESAASLVGEDPSITAALTQEMSGFVQDDPIFWQMREGELDYNGLPIVPDASAPNFWNTA